MANIKKNCVEMAVEIVEIINKAEFLEATPALINILVYWKILLTKINLVSSWKIVMQHFQRQIVI